MKSYYTGKHAARYNQTWRTFSQKTLEAASAAIDIEKLKQYAQKREGRLRILDAGCGTGLLLNRLARLFPSAELHGIDASPDMLAQASQLLQNYPDVHLRRLQLSAETAATLPYPPGYFDLIICSNTLHYFDKPITILQSFKNILAEKGQLILEDYVLLGFPLFWKTLAWAIRLYDPEHRALYSLKAAQQLCQQAGLRVIATQSFKVDLIFKGWVISAQSL